MTEPNGSTETDPDQVLDAAGLPTVDEMGEGEVGGYGGSAAAGEPAGPENPEDAAPPAEPERGPDR